MVLRWCRREIDAFILNWIRQIKRQIQRDTQDSFSILESVQSTRVHSACHLYRVLHWAFCLHLLLPRPHSG